MANLKGVLYEYKEYHGDQFFDRHPGKLLALIRLKKGIRQKNLAGRAKIGSSFLSDIETCKLKPSIYTLNKLANALGKRLIVSITDD